MMKEILICGTVAIIGAFLGALVNKKGRELGEAELKQADSKEKL